MLKHIANLVINTPLLITPDHAETIMAILGERIGVDSAGMLLGDGGARQNREMSEAGRGTRVIPVVGSLTHRPMGLQAMSGVPSYAALQDQIEDAMMDGSVNNILLDVSSPGGMVSGAFDFRDYLMDQRGRKPMMAIARDTMASAAYLIGSATDRVVTTQTGAVGSIGVVMAHIDNSKKLADEGVKPTFIFAGAQKVAGNSAEPLTDEVRAELQASVDNTYGMFVSAVSEAMNLSPEAIKATEARVYTGSAAVEAGLAHEVGTLASALESISDSAPRSYQSMSIQEESDMNEEELRAEGASTERARISAILNHPEAAGRTALAHELAFGDHYASMSADAAGGILSKAAKEPEQNASSDELAAKDAKIAELEAAAESKQGKALENMASEGAGVEAGGLQSEGQIEQSAEDKRAAEAVANARLFFGKK